MATRTLEIVRKYTADTSQWQRALQQIDRSSASTAKAMQRMEQRMDKVGKTMRLLGTAAKGFAVGFAGAFSVSSLRSVTSFADELSNTAQRVGQSVETIQALRAEAEKVGLSFSATDTALQRFSRRVAEARQNTGVLAKVFEQYGVSLRDSQGNQRNVNALLEDFRKVLSGIQDPAERNRVAMAAFDTEGVKLGQTLANLNGTLADTTEELARQGRVIRSEAITAAAELETRFTETAQRLQTVWRNAIVNVVGFIDTLVARFKTFDQQLGASTTYQIDLNIDEVQRQIDKVTTEIRNLTTEGSGGAVGVFQRLFGSDNALAAAQARLAELREQLDALIDRRNALSAAETPDFSALAPPVTEASAPDTSGYSKATNDLREWEQVVIRTLKLNQTQAQRFTQLSSAFDAAAKKFGVDRNLLAAIAKQESGFNQLARSGAGAIGVMQLMPGTAKDIARETGIAYKDLVSTAVGNIEGGAFYIAKRLKQLGGDVTNALAAYNAGIGNVQKFGGVPPFKETQGYVAKIVPDYERLSNATGNLSVMIDRLNSAQQAQNDLLQRGAAVFAETRNDAENYVAKIRELQELYSANVISQETYMRAVEQESTAYQQATSGLEQYAAGLKGVNETSNTLAQSIGENVTVSFGNWIDSAVDGTFRLQDALRGLLGDLAKIALRFAFFGANGGGGLLGGLLGGLFGFAKGAAFPGLPLPQGIYTQPTFFQMPEPGPLKRYASGGVLGEAGAEAVLPLKRLPNGDLGVQGGGTEVTIHNYTGEAVNRRSRQLGDREIIEIAIGQVEERIARGGNSTARALQQAYPGVRRGRL